MTRLTILPWNRSLDGPLLAASRPSRYGFSSSLNDCLQQELTFRMQRFDSRQSNG
jgi:hypothetical protein